MVYNGGVTRGADYHKILNLSADASKEEIRKAYKKSAFAFHPDRNKKYGGHFLLVREAYEALIKETGIKRRPSMHHGATVHKRANHDLFFVKERIKKHKRRPPAMVFRLPKVKLKNDQCMMCRGYGVIEKGFKLPLPCPLCMGTGHKKRKAG